ncbi:hypothetical protein [Streptomyces longhuiensis]|uniref:hypothetical protein n=2 Tax=Streptomyces TaxID=1883 RepID=UPI001D0B89FA|nr:hypothetical protein [Streptomyces longhuiensis]UDL97012.1 hypothetical protein LGI35_01275 [Streptomyces longhuiensis]
MLDRHLHHLPPAPTPDQTSTSKIHYKTTESYQSIENREGRNMEPELLPLVGVGPLRLGMPAQETRDAVQAWGLLRVASSDPEPGQILLKHDASGLT